MSKKRNGLIALLAIGATAAFGASAFLGGPEAAAPKLPKANYTQLADNWRHVGETLDAYQRAERERIWNEAVWNQAVWNAAVARAAAERARSAPVRRNPSSGSSRGVASGGGGCGVPPDNGEAPAGFPDYVIQRESSGNRAASNGSHFGRAQISCQHYASGGGCVGLSYSQCWSKLWAGGAGASNWQETIG